MNRAASRSRTGCLGQPFLVMVDGCGYVSLFAHPQSSQVRRQHRAATRSRTACLGLLFRTMVGSREYFRLVAHSYRTHVRRQPESRHTERSTGCHGSGTNTTPGLVAATSTVGTGRLGPDGQPGRTAARLRSLRHAGRRASTRQGASGAIMKSVLLSHGPYNYGVQPPACAVGKQVKDHGGLAHAAADAER